MPIYEFDCRSCGNAFDKLVRSSTQLGELTCPECMSANIQKKLSLFSSRSGSRPSSPAAAANCAPGGL